MEKVAQAQKQFDQLQAEKQQVESHDLHMTTGSAVRYPICPQLEAALSRVPISGRVTLHNRQQQVLWLSADTTYTSTPLPPTHTSTYYHREKVSQKNI